VALSKARQPVKQVVRYAVVGQGYIAQAAVLPAFKHARGNSRLAAIVSGDPRKRKELARTYDAAAYSYEQYDDLVASGAIDAVYIALPNDQHRDFAVRAARAGVHVLCEKPLAVTEAECRAIINACRRHKVKLMTAYRLHFERATLSALQAVSKGVLGEVKLFASSFTMNVQSPNIRLDADKGGGTLYDIGIYCINIARHLFRAEPEEVFATTVGRKGSVEESATSTLRFPGDRIATFITSFGADKTSQYRVIGTRGSLHVEPGYELASGLKLHFRQGEKERTVKYQKRDQFAPEIVYFSECILTNRDPEPSGEEGLADVRVIRALYKSAKRNRPVRLVSEPLRRQPTQRQERTRPPVRRTPLVNATPPSG
jgi:predicted dehydrogenase